MKIWIDVWERIFPEDYAHYIHMKAPLQVENDMVYVLMSRV